MRFIIRHPLSALCLVLLTAFAHAEDLNAYRIQGNLFDDYRPAHQRANPGAEWERTKAREQKRIDREFEQNRSRSYGGRIDNRDYSRSSRRSDERMHYHNTDSNRHRYSGRIDNRTYGTTTDRSPPGKFTHQWVGPDYSKRQANTGHTTRKNAMSSPSSTPYLNPYATNRKSEKPEKYYGTRSGESLYPYTAKPVTGAFYANTSPGKNSTSRQGAKAAYAAAKPSDPSYGGNKAWGISREARVDTRRFYQDEIAQYRKEHRQQAYCSDGSISGKGSGACSGHGGLLKRSQDIALRHQNR